MGDGRAQKAALQTDPTLAQPEGQGERSDPEEDEEFATYRLAEKTLTRAQKRALLSTLKEFSQVFAKGAYDLGNCNITEPHIDTGDAQLIFTRPRKVPAACRTPLLKELRELVRLGIISDQAESPWAAPIVLVKKKDGTIRLCIDYRLLNQVVARSSYPLPKINEIFAVLQGMRYFSSLDLAKGFWQIRVA